MHFVSMLALDVGIPVSYNVPVTILSAIVAIVATFTTFGYELIVHYVRTFRRVAELKRLMRPVLALEHRQQYAVPAPLDSAAGLDHRESYESVSPKSDIPTQLPDMSEMTYPPMPSRRRWTGLNGSHDHIIKYQEINSNDPDDDNVNVTATTISRQSGSSIYNHTTFGLNPEPNRVSVVHFEPSRNGESSTHNSSYPSFYPPGIQRESATTSASDSLNPDPFAFERSSNGSFSSETMATLFGPGLGQSWNQDEESSEPGHGASIAQLMAVVVTRFSWKIVIKGVLMGLAVVSMHYTGMGAMQMEGTIVWNWWLVALSVVDACMVCMIAIIFSELAGL